MNKFCQYCGCQIKDGNYFCENCGTPVNNLYNNNGNNGNYNNYNNYNNNYNGNYNGNYNYNNLNPAVPVKEEYLFLWGLLGFFIPIAGFVLFLIWLKEKPKTAKSAGLGALIRTIITFFIVMIAIIGLVIGIDKVEEPREADRSSYFDFFGDDWT